MGQIIPLYEIGHTHMTRTNRLGVAATIAALGVSMASPVLNGASASLVPSPLPTSAQLAAALQTLMSSASTLPSLTLNASTPPSGVAAELAGIAAAPGVAGTPAATTLTLLAATLSNPLGVSPTDEQAAITTLMGLSASLPEPLNMLVAELTGALGSGSGLSAIPGISSSEVSDAVAELAGLANLSPGQQSTSLPGLAALLQQLGATAPLAGTAAQTLLDNLAATIASNPVTGSELGLIATALDGVAGSLPSPLSGTVSTLSSQLSTDAAMTGASGGTGASGTGGATGSSGSNGTTGTTGTAGATGATGSAGSSGASGAAGSSGGSTGTSSGGTAGTTTNKAFHAAGLFRSDRRTQHTATVTLYCSATAGRVCNDTITVSESGYRAATKRVHFRSGRTDHWTLVLKPIKTRKAVKHTAKRPVMRIKITSLNYAVTKTLR